MYFAGEYSKFNEGDTAYYKAHGSEEAVPCTIAEIGILGGKLSAHAFLYKILLPDGKQLSVTEQTLSKI